jgi:hypothetical protein
MVRSAWPLVIPRSMAASGEGEGRLAGGPGRKKESASVGLTRVAGEGILPVLGPLHDHAAHPPTRVSTRALFTLAPLGEWVAVGDDRLIRKKERRLPPCPTSS